MMSPARGALSWCILLFSLTIVVTVDAFFSFGAKKEPPPPPPAVPHPTGIRGVPASLAEAYADSERFLCMDGGWAVAKADVNDGFCDCADGSDEPGTSACSNGVFYCINSGYRELTLPSSRIDDGICDCCDGSDEGTLVQCSNTCHIAAEKEREMINRLSAAYRVGSKKREAEEARITADLQSQSQRLPDLIAEAAEAEATANALREDRYAKKAQLDVLFEAYRAAALDRVAALIDFDGIVAAGQLPQFFTSLLETFGIADEGMVLMAVSEVSDSQSHHHNHGDTNPEGEDDAEHFDDAVDSEDPYRDGEPELPPPPHVEATTATTSAAELGAAGEVVNGNGAANSAVVGCSWTPVRSALLDAICEDDPSLDFAKKFLIHGLLKSRRNAPNDNLALKQLQVLLGFYRIHHTFEGSVLYLHSKPPLNNGNEEDEKQTLCPAELAKRDALAAADRSSVHASCSVAEDVRTALTQAFDKSFDTFDDAATAAYRTAESDFYAAKSRQTDVEELRKSAERASEELATHGSHLALLAHKGQCFELSSGNYLYKFCPFDRASQNELHGHNSVTLGDYAELVDHSDSGSSEHQYTMKFTNGQYCHAFGPRSADVHMTCATEDKVLTAREPSTCYYVLEFETPLACNAAFAKAKGFLNVA